MWEERAHRARREIAALATAGPSVSDLHSAAIEVISKQVSTELTCWATIDPETLDGVRHDTDTAGVRAPTG